MIEPGPSQGKATTVQVPWWGWGLGCGILLSGLTLTRLMVVKSRRFAMEVVDGLERPPTFSWPEILRIVALTFVMGFVCGLIVRSARGLSIRYGAFGDIILGAIILEALLLMGIIAFDPIVLSKPWSVLLPLFGIGTGLGAGIGFFMGREVRKELASEGEKAPKSADHLME